MTMVDWKGAKNSKIILRSMTGVIMRVNFFNTASAYDIVTGTYLGFMGFPKKKCGIDLVRALEDGRVSLTMYDYGAYYEAIDSYVRVDGQHTAYMFAFDRFTVGTPDLPGSQKKDQIYLSIEGLDQVDFGAKSADDCLQAVQCGTMPSDEMQVNLAACASYDKDLGSITGAGVCPTVLFRGICFEN